jgi:hypothetical protein
MKVRTFIAAAVMFVASLPLWSADNGASGFDSLKTLAGNWQAKGPDGKPAMASWKLASEGSVLMEEMTHGSMISMYHLDNGRLLLTHYCGIKNQPRMKADVSADGKTITFDFMDATNMASPNDAHMHKMVLTFLDKDHYTETWFFHKDGKETVHATLSYARAQ